MKRKRVNWDRLRAIERDLGFSLSESEPKSPSWFDRTIRLMGRLLRKSWRWIDRQWYVYSDDIFGVLFVAVAIVLGSALGFGIFEGVNAIDLADHPPPLPAHVKIIKNSEDFLVEPSWKGLAPVLCEGGAVQSVTATPIGDIVACKEDYANSFAYGSHRVILVSGSA